MVRITCCLTAAVAAWLRIIGRTARRLPGADPPDRVGVGQVVDPQPVFGERRPHLLDDVAGDDQLGEVVRPLRIGSPALGDEAGEIGRAAGFRGDVTETVRPQRPGGLGGGGCRGLVALALHLPAQRLGDWPHVQRRFERAGAERA
ncbi:hypothetical protein LZK73_34370 (plasmid) [Neorhizobium galegae]|nr:hypothetical protein LZK73_34370 [Neorhizobium galegae]